MSPQDKQAGHEEVTKDLPNVKPLCLTALYNCAGLVFGSRRVWIEEVHIYKIMRDDGYTQVDFGNRATWKIGDVVVYALNDKTSHVGLIAAIKTILTSASFEVSVVSKWGAYGEYLHELSAVPQAYGEPRQVWTHRRGL